MLFLRIISLILPILSIALAIVLVNLFKLKRFKLSVADVALPLLVASFYIVSDQTFYHSLLPLYLILLALVLIGVSVYFLRAKGSFSYHRVLRIFWRLSFIMTFTLYIALVIYIFLFA